MHIYIYIYIYIYNIKKLRRHSDKNFQVCIYICKKSNQKNFFFEAAACVLSVTLN